MALGLLIHIPALVLSAEFFIAAAGRLIPALRTFHGRVYRKSKRTAPALHPIVPFRNNIKLHMRYVGTWLLLTGIMILVPSTRGSRATLGLVLFWTGAGAWSQRQCGMPYRVPVINAGLGLLVYWLEGGAS